MPSLQESTMHDKLDIVTFLLMFIWVNAWRSKNHLIYISAYQSLEFVHPEINEGVCAPNYQTGDSRCYTLRFYFKKPVSGYISYFLST